MDNYKVEVIGEKISENKRTYYMYKCPYCNEIRKVRSDNLPKIKSCHPCHHRVERPEKPKGDFAWCNKCKKWKISNDFCLRKDGQVRQCKECENNYRLQNLSRINNYAKKYRRRNIESSLLYAAKARSKEYNLEFDIDINDISIPEKCPVLGIEISAWSKEKSSSPSIDRIIPSLGYVKNNIRVISWRANWIKNNMTIEEVEMLYKDSKKWKCKGNKSMK